MANSKKKLTQKDVACLAGVSQAIVSHVVNDTDKAIPEATRQRVLKAMVELGYTPNKAARSLRAQTLFPISPTPFSRHFYEGSNQSLIHMITI